MSLFDEVLWTALAIILFLGALALLVSVIALAVPVFRETFGGDPDWDSIEEFDQARQALRHPPRGR